MRNPDWWESYTHNVTSESIYRAFQGYSARHRGECAYSIHTDSPQKRARKTGVWVLRHPGVCVFWGTWGPGFSRSSSQPATRVNFNTRDAWKEKMKAPRGLLLMNGASAWRLTWIKYYNRELKQQRRRLQKRHLKVNLCCFKLNSAYSISFNWWNVGEFFLELNSKRVYQNSEKGKESRCLVFRSSTKREIRQSHVVVVQRRQRRVQKSVMHV